MKMPQNTCPQDVSRLTDIIQYGDSVLRRGGAGVSFHPGAWGPLGSGRLKLWFAFRQGLLDSEDQSRSSHPAILGKVTVSAWPFSFCGCVLATQFG